MSDISAGAFVRPMSSLRYSFSRSQRGSYGGPGLGDVVVLSFNLLWRDPAIMLMSPYNKLDRIIKHAFGYALLGSMLDSARQLYPL